MQVKRPGNTGCVLLTGDNEYKSCIRTRTGRDANLINVRAHRESGKTENCGSRFVLTYPKVGEQKVVRETSFGETEMRQQEGMFILFDIDEFSSWLPSVKVSRKIKLIQNHHTFIPSYDDFKGTNHFDLLTGMEAAHLKRGFAQIAQNMTTFPDGTVAVCRPFTIAPAGIKGANRNGLCIENLGNFDEARDTMTSEQRDSIIKLTALLCQRFSLSPSSDTVVFHHWYDLKTGKRKNGTGTTKTCPGTNFFGGNTVLSSQGNFIPLISESLAGLPMLTTGEQTTQSADAGGN